MKSYIGYELSVARNELEEKGFIVICTEVRSRRGVPGDTNRVIRQISIDENTVELCFSCFICKIAAEK